MVCSFHVYAMEIKTEDNGTSPDQKRKLANKKLGFKLLWIVAGSIAFSIALVPLYNVLCTLTGLNGKTETTASEISNTKVDESRWVTVQFTSNVMPGLGWNFHPKQSSIKLHPGQIQTVLFEAKNITSQVVAGQAVPSVSPGVASIYFKKIECFCFTRQELQPGETKLMPLRFFISPDLPSDISEMTLSYAFFIAGKP